MIQREPIEGDQPEGTAVLSPQYRIVKGKAINAPDARMKQLLLNRRPVRFEMPHGRGHSYQPRIAGVFILLPERETDWEALWTGLRKTHKTHQFVSEAQSDLVCASVVSISSAGGVTPAMATLAVLERDLTTQDAYFWMPTRTPFDGAKTYRLRLAPNRAGE